MLQLLTVTETSERKIVDLKDFIYGLPMYYILCERLSKRLDPCFFFLSQKVKFWGLIFQSGPRNRESTFWKTTSVKPEKVKFLPFCHRPLRSNWTASGNRTNSVYLLHRKRSSKGNFFCRNNVFKNWIWTFLPTSLSFINNFVEIDILLERW